MKYIFVIYLYWSYANINLFRDTRGNNPYSIILTIKCIISYAFIVLKINKFDWIFFIRFYCFNAQAFHGSYICMHCICVQYNDKRSKKKLNSKPKTISNVNRDRFGGRRRWEPLQIIEWGRDDVAYSHIQRDVNKRRSLEARVCVQWSVWVLSAPSEPTRGQLSRPD